MGWSSKRGEAEHAGSLSILSSSWASEDKRGQALLVKEGIMQTLQGKICAGILPHACQIVRQKACGVIGVGS